LVSGLFKVAGLADPDMDGALEALGFPELRGKVRVEPKSLGAVGGWGLSMELPHEREHRTLADVLELFEKSKISAEARESAERAFWLLARAEGEVHSLPPERVEFHEVGALDSILDTGLAAVFFHLLAPALFVSGPLPLCDGTISCAHGLLASPAPAVSILLQGAAVRGISSEGETVTPTGIALLKAFGASYGPWPEMTVETQALIYGGRTLPGVPNGALFAAGRLSGGAGLGERP
jgi:uncharacterized protein (DUF111 family)